LEFYIRRKRSESQPEDVRPSMNVQFLGATRTVTGSCTLLESGSLKFLVDCGLFQGGKTLEERNRNVDPYRPRDLSFILLTHAHIDHSGLIPKLVQRGFQGKIFCTRATLDLCEIMLRDSAHVQEMEAEWQNRKNKRSGRNPVTPLYTAQDAEQSLQFFQPVNYGEMLSLSEGVRVRFQDAGHILGSAIIEIWIEEEGVKRKLVFSGDLGNFDQPIVRDPTPIEEADLLWLESTYGNRLHKSRKETVEEFLAILQEAIGSRSKVIIPAFAVERTQDILYTIGQFLRERLIPPLPIYIDSPLAIAATEVFKRNADSFDQEMGELLRKGENPLELPEIVFAQTTEESKAINEDERPGIIISASGMCDAGRIQHHLKHHLWRKDSHIVFTGFQAAGTVGRRIVDGARSVRLFGEEIAIHAHIHTLGGFSAHADQKGLLEWVSHFRSPGLKVFVTHGEEQTSLTLAERIREQFHWETVVPRWMEKRRFIGHEEAVEEAPVQVIPREEDVSIPEETMGLLFRELENHYRRLRRKLKRAKWKRREFQDPQLLKQLEEIDHRVEALEKQLR
jgi:metallo-beta-lactamase family protein